MERLRKKGKVNIKVGIRYFELPRDQKKKVRDVCDDGKLKILAFYKALGKPNTTFTTGSTLVIFQGNRTKKIYRYFYSNWYFIFG